MGPLNSSHNWTFQQKWRVNWPSGSFTILNQIFSSVTSLSLWLDKHLRHWSPHHPPPLIHSHCPEQTFFEKSWYSLNGPPLHCQHIFLHLFLWPILFHQYWVRNFHPLLLFSIQNFNGLLLGLNAINIISIKSKSNLNWILINAIWIKSIENFNGLLWTAKSFLVLLPSCLSK